MENLKKYRKSGLEHFMKYVREMPVVAPRRIYQLLETSESEEIDEDRLDEIRSSGFTRWLDEEVRAPVETWIDQDFRTSAPA